MPDIDELKARHSAAVDAAIAAAHQVERSSAEEDIARMKRAAAIGAWEDAIQRVELAHIDLMEAVKRSTRR